MAKGVRSVVRLKRLQDTNCCCGYASRIIPKLFPVSRGVMVKDRELRMGGIGSTRLALGERPNGLIEGGSEAVEGITSDERNVIGNLINFYPQQVASILHVVLSKETYGFGFNKGVYLLPQTVKVFLRPFGFQIGIAQSHESISA